MRVFHAYGTSFFTTTEKDWIRQRISLETTLDIYSEISRGMPLGLENS